MADRLAALRGPDESYSNVILRPIELEVQQGLDGPGNHCALTRGAVASKGEARKP